MFESRITHMVHSILQDHIGEGDLAIDATVGNGHDTEFLAEAVGDMGHVYGFDIQDMAIEATGRKLNERNLGHRVTLIKDSHAKVKDYVKAPVKLAMFNLGYLPKGDKEIITKPTSTIGAIEGILDLMGEESVMAIVAYYGHVGGMEEKDAVRAYIQGLEHRQYDVISIQYENRKNNAPIIYLVRKKH